MAVHPLIKLKAKALFTLQTALGAAGVADIYKESNNRRMIYYYNWRCFVALVSLAVMIITAPFYLVIVGLHRSTSRPIYKLHSRWPVESMGNETYNDNLDWLESKGKVKVLVVNGVCQLWFRR